MLLQVQRRQHHLRRDRLVPVCHEGREPVTVNRDAPVWVPYEDVELQGGRQERRGGGVEAVDRGADHREAGLVGAVDEPEDEEGDAS